MSSLAGHFARSASASRIWARSHTIIVRRSLAHPGALPDTPADAEFVLEERNAVDGAMWSFYESRSEGFTRAQLERRFRAGLRFFEFVGDDGRIAATTWIVCAGDRYLDELAIGIPLGANEIWVRDLYVAPAFRGQRLFGRLLDSISATHFPTLQSIASDLDSDNEASDAAHRYSGFVPVYECTSTVLFGRWLVRNYDGEMGPTSYARGMRWVTMNSRFHAHQERHTA